VRTRVGYTGGTTLDPTYTELGDHTESIELEYDPQVVDYGTLLELYWEGASGASASCDQYAPIIFWHNDEQRDLAQASWDEHDEPEVAVREAEHFYPAEDYHQKYRLRNVEVVFRDFERMYDDHDDIVRSTAAARCNGILAGYGSWDELGAELDSYGLTEAARQELEGRLGR